MKRIELTRGRIALIDNEDYKRVSERQWNATRGSYGRVYATCSQRIDGRKRNIKMHRFILGLTDPKIEVDHIDGNTLNNQKKNLRCCTHQENMANMAKRRTKSTSSYKGVSFHRHSGLWRATIQFTHLGYFRTEEDAARAYNLASIKRFGRFARVNVVS